MEEKPGRSRLLLGLGLPSDQSLRRVSWQNQKWGCASAPSVEELGLPQRNNSAHWSRIGLVAECLDKSPRQEAREMAQHLRVLEGQSSDPSALIANQPPYTHLKPQWEDDGCWGLLTFSLAQKMQVPDPRRDPTSEEKWGGKWQSCTMNASSGPLCMCRHVHPHSCTHWCVHTPMQMWTNYNYVKVSR